MKSNKRLYLVLAGCLAVVAVIAAVYLSGRNKVEGPNIELVYNEKTTLVSLNDIASTDVKGETINGKGEKKAVEEKGILLNDLLTSKSVTTFEEVEVEADDAYKATVSNQEVTQEKDVYLTVKDEQVTMYVFKDQNSKRNVRNIIRITVK